MKKYEKILSMDQKYIINMVKNFNEKSQVYNYIRNVIVDDAEKKKLETFGSIEVEDVLLFLLPANPCYAQTFWVLQLILESCKCIGCIVGLFGPSAYKQNAVEMSCV